DDSQRRICVFRPAMDLIILFYIPYTQNTRQLIQLKTCNSCPDFVVSEKNGKHTSINMQAASAL
ncbi:MAG: hypothetical protein V3S33_00705, partial [Gammaproteobacteria bacterium]